MRWDSLILGLVAAAAAAAASVAKVWKRRFLLGSSSETGEVAGENGFEIMAFPARWLQSQARVRCLQTGHAGLQSAGG